jgi:hypothetical protein
MAPFPDDPILGWQIVRNAYQHLRGQNGFTAPAPYVMSLALLTLYKFGGARAVSTIRTDLTALCEKHPAFARQAVLIMTAAGFKQEAMRSTVHLYDVALNQITKFIAALESGDSRAVGIVLSLAKPKKTAGPARYVLPARVLPLLAIMKQAGVNKPQLDAVVTNTRQALLSDPLHRDGVTLTHL